MNGIVAEDATGERSLPTVGTILDGRFELRASLGEGGMGHVFRAFDRQLAREVALKLIVPRYLGREVREQRFLRELELGRRAERHPHLVVMVGGGRLHESGWPFLVMELVEGRSLANRLVLGPLRATVAARTARQIAEATRALHRKGVVHRDLTPMNVLMHDDDAVLIDLSHAGDANGPRLPAGHPRRLTRENEIPGTHQYMPPEQARSEPAHPAMDVYAFGVTLAHMLVGLTFDQYSREAYLQLHREGKIKPPRIDIRVHTKVPRRLAELVEACTARDPAERPTMDGVIQWLDDVLAAMVMSAEASGPTFVVVREPDEAATGRGHVARTQRLAQQRRAEVIATTPISPPPPLDTEEIPTGDAPVRVAVEGAQPRTSQRVVVAVVVLVGLLAALAWWWSSRSESDDRVSGERPEPGIVGTATTPLGHADAEPNAPGPGVGLEPAGQGGRQAPPEIEPPADEPSDDDSTRPEDQPEPTTKVAEPETPAPGQSSVADPKASQQKPGKRRQPPSAKVPDHDTEACKRTVAEARSAEASHAWSRLVASTRDKKCFENRGEWAEMRVRALLETGRFDECLALGGASKNPNVKMYAGICRAQKGNP